MFYLDGRDDAAAKYGLSSPSEENFGWWLSDREVAVSPGSHRVKDHPSPGSSCSDSGESDGYSFARDVSRQEQESGICEKIEMTSFTRDNLDIDLIERDAREMVSTTMSCSLPCEMFPRLKFPNRSFTNSPLMNLKSGLIQKVLQKVCVCVKLYIFYNYSIIITYILLYNMYCIQGD